MYSTLKKISELYFTCKTKEIKQERTAHNVNRDKTDEQRDDC